MKQHPQRESNDMRTTSIMATGRLLTCAALALGLTGLSATVALAHDNEVTKTKTVTKDWTSTDFSPCTNEAIDITGKQVLRSKVKGTPPGKFHSIETVDESGKGTGQVSDDRYKYSNATEQEFRSSTCNFTSRFEVRKKIIRVDCPEWRNDDFFQHDKITVRVSGSGANCGMNIVSSERLNQRCK